MSEQSQGSGWWQASDDRWYAPELHPDYRSTPPQTPPSWDPASLEGPDDLSAEPTTTRGRLDEASRADAPGTSPRAQAVARVLKLWRSQLIDVSAGNRLLYYRDQKVATLDLANVTQSARAELRSGRPTRLRRLWTEPQELQRAVKSLRAIARPARVYAEEFGLQITFVATGFATWEGTERSKPPCAPVLLTQLTLRALPGTADGFEIQAAEDVQLNPVLAHFLEAEFGVAIDEAELLEGTDGDNTLLFERLSKLCRADLPGFQVKQREVIANFAYASQSMVSDLGDENAEFLAGHDMIAALAGDADASNQVRTQGSEVRVDAPDLCPPSDEHLILDADGSQSYVINAIAGGQHLVVQGPPGTGKTQTITNTIAELVARGKTVLFVAQKRAAIIAVLDRLRSAHLDHLVLDLFDGATSRKAVVDELGRSIDQASVTARPNVDALHRAYTSARDLLVTHRQAMHETRSPWGLSLLGSKEGEHPICVDGFYDWAVRTLSQQTEVRLPMADLEGWGPETHDELRSAIEELFATGGLTAATLSQPGWSVAGLTSNEALLGAEEVVTRLVDSELPATVEWVRVVVGELGIQQPERITAVWCRNLLELLSDVEQMHASGRGPLVSPMVDDELLKAFAHATANRDERKDEPSPLGMLGRRKRRRELESLVPGLDGAVVHQAVAEATRIRARWSEMTDRPLPAGPSPSWAAMQGWYAQTVRSTKALAPFVQGLDASDLRDLSSRLDAMRNDRRRRLLPRINGLRRSLAVRGCTVVLDDLAVSPASDAGGAADRLSHAFARTVIEHIDRTDARLFGYSSADLDRATAALIEADEKLRDANVSRVRRAAAERLIAALDAHPDQAERLRGQVKRKRGFQPVRNLVGSMAPDVVLAAKPVWAASPQVVSQLLPARRLFDVVLFDEASQVLPAAALPAIARGSQVVVAGDDLQLPPTTIFTRTAELELDEPLDLDHLQADDEPGSGSEDSAVSERRGLVEIPDTESILDAISVKLGTQRSRYLGWHYRSRDEKLIATSNSFVYRPRGRMMTTFPAADSVGALEHVLCPPSTGLGPSNLSPAGEVSRVVDLMLAHAAAEASTEHPRSLGVIAFGVKHAARIERALDQRLAAAPEEVRDYFSRETLEPYFVKNIERVQGDERDVIILTVGYARGTDGKLRYSWGPVLTDGGHRRVNVAITRARSRMALVTSFGTDEVDPTGSRAEGFALMHRFLRYASSGGQDFGDAGTTHVPCNPFEADIQDRLEAQGLRVVPQWGVGGYRIDFAVQHPDLPGRFLLAVEADGASYHSGVVARERDRLRQRQLEARGWRFVRIWSSDYFFDPDGEIDRVVGAYEEQLAVATGTPSPAAPAPSGDPLDLEPPARSVPDWDASTPARTVRPAVSPGGQIKQYSDAELRSMVRWVVSDDLPRTRVEVYDEVKRALGFERDGRIIRERITGAVDTVLGEVGRC